MTKIEFFFILKMFCNNYSVFIQQFFCRKVVLFLSLKVVLIPEAAIVYIISLVISILISQVIVV